MAGPNRALFDTDGDNADAGFLADPGDVVTFTLRNPNVQSWQLQVWDTNQFASGNQIADNPPRKSKNAPDVQLVGATTGTIVAATTPNASITLTLPNTGNGINSYLIRSIVDGGMTRGQPDPAKVHQRIISTAPGGLRKPVVTERGEFEFDSWAGVICDIIDALFGLSGGTAASAGSRAAVRAATATALPAYTRSGNILTANANGALPVIDGVTLAVGNRVLLVDGAGPSSAAHAGIYTVTSLGGAGSPWSLTRATDMDTNAEVEPGVHFWVLEGTANGGSLAVLVSPSSGITINTTNLDFTLYDLTGGGGGGGLPAAAKGDTYVNDGTAVDVVPIGTSGQVYGVPYGQGSGGMPSYFDPDFDQIFPGNAKGDTIQWNGTTWIITPPGQPGQVPVVDDDGTIVFEDPPNGLPDGQEGDLTIFKGGVWTRLGIGPSGSVVGNVGGYPGYLLVGSGSGGSGGGSGTFFPIGPKGSMLVSNGTAWEYFEIGAKGTWLGSDGTMPGWASIPAAEAGYVKLPVRTAVLTNVASLAGEQTLSSVALEEGDRVLLTAQDDAEENGIWVVDSATWTRAEDFDLAAEMARGLVIIANEGNPHDSLWMHSTAVTPIVVGTTELSFERITPPVATEFESMLVCVGRNQFEWRSGNEGQFVGIVGGEIRFVEIPESTGGGGGTGPDIALSPSAWQSVVVDAAIQHDGLPPHTTDSSTFGLTASANGQLPQIDGLSLLNSSTLLVFGESTKCGIYRVSDRGSPTSPWRLTRVNYGTTSATQVVRSNRTVSVRYGTVYHEVEFLHLTGGAPGALTVPGSEVIDLGVTVLLYLENRGSTTVGTTTTALSDVVYADYAARNLGGFAVQLGNTIAATQDGTLTFDDGLPTSCGVGDRVFIYGTTSIPAMNGVYRVDSVGNTTLSPRWRMTRVPEMDTAEKFLACKIITVLSGNGNGSDHRATTWFNYTDPDQPFVLNTTIPTFGVEREEISQVVWAEIAVDIASLPAFTKVPNVERIQATANGPFPTIDGVAPTTFMRYLISGTSIYAGVWRVVSVGNTNPPSPWELARVSELTTAAQFSLNKVVAVTKGARGIYTRTQGGLDAAIVLNTTAFTYVNSVDVSGSSRVIRVKAAGIYDTGVPSNTRTGSNRTANQNGTITCDALTLVAGDKFLLFGANAGCGVWTVTNAGSASTPWTAARSSDMNTSAQVDDNAIVEVMLGSSFGGHLFTRQGPVTPATLNTSVLEWYDATPDAGLSPARDVGNPLCYDTSDGLWKPFHSFNGTQSAFTALVLKNIRSSTTERGLVIEELSDALPSRAILDRRRVSAGELVGSVAEIVGRTYLASSTIGDGYSETHHVTMDSSAPSSQLAGPTYDRVSSIALKLAGWTANARQTMVFGNAARFFPGGLFAERPEPVAVGHETSVGFMRNANVLGRIYSRVTDILSGTVRTVELGIDTIWESEIIKAGHYLTDRRDTTNATAALFAKTISLAAGQMIELDYTIVGIRSDSNAHALARGSLVANRLATGNVLLMSHDPYPIQRSSNAAGWGDETQTRAQITNTGIEFQVVGAATQIRWQLRCGWAIYTQNGVGA